jgi:hypothetical protein
MWTSKRWPAGEHGIAVGAIDKLRARDVARPGAEGDREPRSRGKRMGRRGLPVSHESVGGTRSGGAAPR